MAGRARARPPCRHLISAAVCRDTADALMLEHQHEERQRNGGGSGRFAGRGHDGLAGAWTHALSALHAATRRWVHTHGPHLHLHAGRSQKSVWQTGPAARCARQNECGGRKLWAQLTCREKRSPVTPCTPVPLLPLLPASRNAEIHHYPLQLIVLGQNEGTTAFPEQFMPVKKRHGVQELVRSVLYLKRRGPATAAARERGGCDVWRSASWRPSRWHLHRARLRSAAPCVLAPCGPL